MNTIFKFVIAAAVVFVTSSSSDAQTAYAIADSGATLISFEITNPLATTIVGSFSGASTNLQGIDFRPLDGLLYGYASNNTIVTINLANAVTTLASTPSITSTNTNLGVDFNPVADRLRLVNIDDQNLRINVGSGATIADGPLAFAAGDPNFGVDPNVVEAAYTNSDNNPGTGTSLFYIDIGSDSLISTINPNGGVLLTVGALGSTTNSQTGFDILSDGIGGNSAFAILTSRSTPELFSINLSTGAATLIGALNATQVFGLALVQPVPEPGTALFGLALFGASLACRRHRTVSRD